MRIPRWRTNPDHRERWCLAFDGDQGVSKTEGRDVSIGHICRGTERDHWRNGLDQCLLRKLGDPRRVGDDDGGATKGRGCEEIDARYPSAAFLFAGAEGRLTAVS